jgi:hypothetical protein
MANTAERMLEEYLAEVRDGLGSLPGGMSQEIVEELRSHVYERAGPGGNLTEEGTAAALERLGPARTLAAGYVRECGISGSESGSPRPKAGRRVLDGILVGPAGLFVIAGSILCYGLALVLAFSALTKLYAPDRAGLWHAGDEWSLHLGLAAGQPAGTEVLGWWIVPMGLVTGVSLAWLTARVGSGSRH